MPFTVRSPAAGRRVIRHPYLHSCRAASPASLTLVLREVHTVKIQRLGQVAALALVGSIALAGCGSDNNTAGTALELLRHRLRGIRRLLRGHPERRGLLGAEERLRGGRSELPREVPRRHGQLQPHRLRRGHQAVHRRPGRLRRLRLGAEDRGEGRRHRGRRRRQDLRLPRLEPARWSPARSRSPTTSRASTSWSSRRPSPPTSSTARSPPGTTRPSPRSTPASPCRRPPIKVFFRSDESGTTENFTKYLNAAAPDAWTAEPGQGVDAARARARRSRPVSPRA